jgi:DNA-binding transcriptional regulator YiaG
MTKKKKESRFVRDIREGVDEYLAWSRGEKRMKITHVEKSGARVQFYATGPEAKAYQDRVEEFKRTRGVLELSQTEMAELLRVSVGAVQQWEIGRRRIPGTAMLVAEIARDYPEVREKIMPKRKGVSAKKSPGKKKPK